MDMKKYEYQSDFAKKYFAIGRAEAETPGYIKGMAEGLAGAVIAVLAARGIAVPADVRDRVLACTDLVKLERWVVRAATVGTVDALFGGPCASGGR